jgi:hypothetical protein
MILNVKTCLKVEKHCDVALNPAILLRTNEQYAWCAEYLFSLFLLRLSLGVSKQAKMMAHKPLYCPPTWHPNDIMFLNCPALRGFPPTLLPSLQAWEPKP